MPPRPGLWTKCTFVGVILLGALFICASLISHIFFNDAWVPNLLINLGASLLLVVPLYYVTSRLDEHVTALEHKTTSGIESIRAATASTVQELENRVDRKLEDISAAVSQTLEADFAETLKVFQQIACSPSRSRVEYAIERAEAMALISSDLGPRVRVSEQDSLYLRLQHNSAGLQMVDRRPSLDLVLERIDGQELEVVGWHPEESTDDVMVEAWRAIERHGPTQGFTVAHFFEALSNTLIVASDNRACRPIIEISPPQWAVTESGLTTYGDAPRYDVVRANLRNRHFTENVQSKTWVEQDSFDRAREVGLSLFGSADDVWGLGTEG